MKDTFLKITTKLKTITELKWIDADEGQLDYYDNPPVTFPCALVDIDMPSCDDINSESQQCKVRITIRLAFLPTGQSNTAVPVLVQTNALKRYETIKKIYQALQGYGDSEMSELSRVSQMNEKRNDDLKVVQQVWETSFEESVD